MIGVLDDVKSRGGSRYVHEQLRCGTTLPIGKPRNNFALDEEAASTVLVAGGIGITPMLCMYRRLRQRGRDVRLVYCARSRSQAAFLDELDALGGDCVCISTTNTTAARSISPRSSRGNTRASTRTAADRARC